MACGDDEPSEQRDGDEASGLAAQPEPSEPIEEVLGPFNAAIEEGDCKAFAALTHSELRPKAGGIFGQTARSSPCSIRGAASSAMPKATSERRASW